MNILNELMIPNQINRIQINELRGSIGACKLKPKILKLVQLFPRIIKLIYNVIADTIEYADKGFYQNENGEYIGFNGLEFGEFNITICDINNKLIVNYNKYEVIFDLIRQTNTDIHLVCIFARDQYI